MKARIILLMLFVFELSFGQKYNAFLNRKLWKEKPSIQKIEQLIAEGNSLTEKNRHSMDALTYAILENTPTETVKHMIEKGVNVNTLTHDKRNYVFWAGYKGNLELMEYLVAKGCKTNVRDAHNMSLIQFTAIGGVTDTKVYDFCIKHGADIKEIDKEGRNVAFLYAFNMKDVAFLDFFTKKGVDIYAKDNEGNNLFNHAASLKDVDVLKKLKAKGFKTNLVSKKGQNAMSFLTQFRHRGGKKLTQEAMTYLEDLGVNTNFITENGSNILHSLAFVTSDKDILKKYLNSTKFNANLANKKGNTPLIHAAYTNNKDGIALFLEKTSNINHKNKKGASALTFAVKRNKVDAVAFLLEKGADINVKNNKGEDLIFALVDAQRGGKTDIFNKKLDLLTSKGLKIDNANSKLIHKAIKKKNLNLLQALLTYKLDVNGKNKEGLTPLQVAVMTGKNTKLIQSLLKAGANKSVKTRTNETIYDLALANEIFKSKNINIAFLK